MNTMMCFITTDSDFLALMHLLIECNFVLMSFDNVIVNIKLSNARLKKHAKYRTIPKPSTNCTDKIVKYLIGFVGSNGNLFIAIVYRNIQLIMRTNEFQIFFSSHSQQYCEIVESYHAGMGISRASLPKSVVKYR